MNSQPPIALRNTLQTPPNLSAVAVNAGGPGSATQLAQVARQVPLAGQATGAEIGISPRMIGGGGSPHPGTTAVLGPRPAGAQWQRIRSGEAPTIPAPLLQHAAMVHGVVPPIGTDSSTPSQVLGVVAPSGGFAWRQQTGVTPLVPVAARAPRGQIQGREPRIQSQVAAQIRPQTKLASYLGPADSAGGPTAVFDVIDLEDRSIRSEPGNPRRRVPLRVRRSGDGVTVEVGDGTTPLWDAGETLLVGGRPVRAFVLGMGSLIETVRDGETGPYIDKFGPIVILEVDCDRFRSHQIVRSVQTITYCPGQARSGRALPRGYDGSKNMEHLPWRPDPESAAGRDGLLEDDARDLRDRNGGRNLGMFDWPGLPGASNANNDKDPDQKLYKVAERWGKSEFYTFLYCDEALLGALYWCFEWVVEYACRSPRIVVGTAMDWCAEGPPFKIVDVNGPDSPEKEAALAAWEQAQPGIDPRKP